MANTDDQLPSPEIGLPRVDAAMNKIAPSQDRKDDRDDKGKPKKRKPKAEDDASIIRRMRKRFDRSFSYESKNREQGMKALKMVNNEQWDDGDLKARSGRPTITVNKLKVFVNQVANGQREQRPSINISPEGDRGDRVVAKMLRGVVRKIERDSGADIAYDTGFWNACANGIGWWRVVTDYESPDSFNQIIEIRRVRNPYTVYDDPQSQEPDGADGKWRFVTEMIDRDDFKDQYPGFDPIDFEGQNAGEAFRNWVNEKQLRIVEYFETTFEKFRLLALSNGWIGSDDELDPKVKGMIDSGELEIVQERESERPVIKWYKATAKQILERKDWPGKWIPLVKVIGNEVDVEGKVTLTGVIGDALDTQRMYNFWASLQTELLAMAPKSPFIIAEGQIEGYEDQWDQANTKPVPYLIYKPTDHEGNLVPAPQRQPFAGVPQGVVEARTVTAQDMQATTGIRFDATMHERMNDESGRALREIRRATDIGTYHFIDNHARSLRHTGVILIDLIPKIYDTKRIMTIIREDDKEEAIVIDPYQAEATRDVPNPGKPGTKLTSINPKYGRYGVTVTTGPSYATKRIEASQSMMDFVRALPAAGQSTMDLIAKNQDWPDAEIFAARLAKMIPAQLHDDPNLKGLPPEVQGIIGSQKSQIVQLSQQLMMAMKQLNDTSADRAVKQDKNDKDFEAKLLAIVQKAQATQDKEIGGKVEALAGQVTALFDLLQQRSQALHMANQMQPQGPQPAQPALGISPQGAGN